MARPKITARDAERIFTIDQLFFSTTDIYGTITSGNDVFVEVSGRKSLNELLGEAHNCIRHPDMPRAAFKILWDRLKEGRTAAVYVKNLALDGNFYWVVALIAPTTGGYLSIRFKPSSPLFKVVKTLYAEMLAIEMSDNDSPETRDELMERSGAYLVERLQELNYTDYDHFMQNMLAKELSSRYTILNTERVFVSSVEKRTLIGRAKLLGLMLEDFFSSVDEFLAVCQQLEQKLEFLCQLGINVRLFSMNGLIEAERIGHSGRALAVVTDRMTSSAGEITELVANLGEDIQPLIITLRKAAFTLAASRLQSEMATFFLQELIRTERNAVDKIRDPELVDRIRRDLQVLVKGFTVSIESMLEALLLADEPVSNLEDRSVSLSRSLRALSQVHVIGKVEATRIAVEGRFAHLFQEVFSHINEAEREIKEMNTSLEGLGTRMDLIIRCAGPLRRSCQDLSEAVSQYGIPSPGNNVRLAA